MNGMMTGLSRREFMAAALLGGFSATQAAAQTMPQGADPAMHTLHQPYDIESFGAFRDTILKGDFTPMVKLAAVMAKHPTTGVGAVAGARGEITIYDGKLVVSYGKTAPHPAADNESAALLGTGAVSSWQTVTVTRDVAPEEIEAFLADTAKAHGLDPEQSFPFEIRGTLMSYAMHVNTAPTNGPHGMGLPIAITAVSRGDTLAGSVAGLYVSRDLVGVISHGGEFTHAHWVSPDGTATAHLDRWGLKSGALLSLPKA